MLLLGGKCKCFIRNQLQTTGTDPGFFSSWDLPLLPTPDFFPVGIYLFLFTPALFSC